MHLHASTAARRILAAAALTCAAALVPAAALAAPGHHASAARTATPACATSGLDVWLNTNGTGATGHVIYQLNFTNLSGSTCTLFGYPGVSALYGKNDKQLGRAAAREPGWKSKTVTIPAGGTAHAYLFWAEVLNFTPSQCRPATASLLRVYPPNRKSSAVTFFSLQGCQNTKPLFQYLFVSTVQPGVGHAL